MESNSDNFICFVFKLSSTNEISSVEMREISEHSWNGKCYALFTPSRSLPYTVVPINALSCVFSVQFSSFVILSCQREHQSDHISNCNWLLMLQHFWMLEHSTHPYISTLPFNSTFNLVCCLLFLLSTQIYSLKVWYDYVLFIISK